MNEKIDTMAGARIAIRLAPEVKEWYIEKAKYYGMQMAPYMQLILMQHYEAQQNTEALRNLSNVGSSEDLSDTKKLLLEILERLPKDEKSK